MITVVGAIIGIFGLFFYLYIIYNNNLRFFIIVHAYSNKAIGGEWELKEKDWLSNI
jgi:hypothetical protein